MSCKVAGLAFEPELQRKLDVLPTRILKKLSMFGLLDNARVEGSKPLTEHLTDFEKYLLAKGNTARHCRQTKNSLLRVFEACKFRMLSDISATRFLGYIADQKTSGKISQRTANFYIKAGKQFGHWMVQHRRAGESPLSVLTCETITERKRQRRALEPDDIRRLLEATKAAGERSGMTGYERALLYRFATETGLRANELRSLKIYSFDFANLTVTTAETKNKRIAVLPLRADTAAELKEFFANKLPSTNAFGGTYNKLTDRTSEMLQKDLECAGIDYVDDSGRYFDFHALRGECSSLLAAAGVHPKLAQSIMRHSDINLTMNAYTHTLRGQEAEAIEKLPDFSLPSSNAQRKVMTGTDEQSVFDSSLDKQCVLERTGLDCSGQNNRISDKKTAFSTGRYRIRTCDPLIKSQLLCQLS